MKLFAPALLCCRLTYSKGSIAPGASKNRIGRPDQNRVLEATGASARGERHMFVQVGLNLDGSHLSVAVGVTRAIQRVQQDDA